MSLAQRIPDSPKKRRRPHAASLGRGTKAGPHQSTRGTRAPVVTEGPSHLCSSRGKQSRSPLGSASVGNRPDPSSASKVKPCLEVRMRCKPPIRRKKKWGFPKGKQRLPGSVAKHQRKQSSPVPGNVSQFTKKKRRAPRSDGRAHRESRHSRPYPYERPYCD